MYSDLLCGVEVLELLVVLLKFVKIRLWQHCLGQILCGTFAVEVPRVNFTCKILIGLKRWDHWAVKKSLSVQWCEKRMFQNLFHIAIAAETLRLIFVQKLVAKVLEIIWIVNFVSPFVRKNYFRLSDLKQQQFALLIIKWSHTNQHLVDKDAQSPPINRKVVTLVKHHLRSQVLWSSAESLRHLIWS